MADAEGVEISLEFTPLWVVALVCFVVVLISILVDRFLLCAGQGRFAYRSDSPTPGFFARSPILLPLSPVSLLVPLLPAEQEDAVSSLKLLGKVPLLSVEALHHLDIFIFVLATFHVVLCALKVVLGYAKIRQLSKLEEHDVGSTHYNTLKRVFTEKLRDYNNRRHSKSAVPGWVEEFFDLRPSIDLHFPLQQISFFKQFYPSVTEFEYIALRLNFMVAHDLQDPKKDFQKYIIGAVQKDFEKMVGIRWIDNPFIQSYLIGCCHDEGLVINE
ncbi:hypothetical protein NL676_019095 [Syzygium grande]|nr:hypothetical protein NL676_019095 [Syzygium grande]